MLNSSTKRKNKESITPAQSSISKRQIKKQKDLVIRE